MKQSSVLLYDGLCGFCNKSVQFILDHDKAGTLRFAPLQSNYGRAVIERHPDLENIDSLVFLESPGTSDERVFIRSNAALHVAAYLGGIWRLFLLAYIIPAPIRDLFYDLFARFRYRVFGKYDSCMVPPKEVKARFLDIS
jgi:predicted DCC family thiol-disulfide oxidoreductase YuxK